MKRLVGLCAVCLMAVGCGGGGKTGGPPATVSDFCTQYNAAVHGVLERCLQVPKDAIPLVFGTTDTQLCANMAAAIASKRATYDATEAQACLDGLNKSTCGDVGNFGRPGDPCLKVLTGQVADGKSCYGDIDCKTASYCKGVSGGSCPGTCTAYATKGGACFHGQTCGEGLYCDGSVCQADGVKGDACGGGTPGGCGPGLYCDGINGGPGGCQPRLAAGATCSYPSQCEVGFTCMGGKCAPRLGLGKACTHDSDCGIYTHCGAGKCTENPTTGGTCGYDSEGVYVTCLGSRCNITNQSTYTGTCAAYLKAGDACQTAAYQPCGTGVCDASTNKCVAACMEPSH